MITDDRLLEYALGALDDAEMAAIEAAVAADPSLQAALAAIHEVLAGLAEAGPAVAPTPARRDDLVAAAPPRPRLVALAEDLGRFFDVSSERARAHLQSMNDDASWEPSPFPGMDLIHVDGGPAVAGPDVDVGIVRMPGGQPFPYHVHGQGESVMILQGGLRDSSGQIMLAGDVMSLGPNTGHSFDSLPGPDLIYAVILSGGQTFPPPA